MSVFIKPRAGQQQEDNTEIFTDPEDPTAEDKEDDEADESREAADERVIEEIIEADEDHPEFSVTDDDIKLGRIAVEKVCVYYLK